MPFRPAVPADIPRIVALERTPEARNFVGQWSEERHFETMTGGDARYFVSESAAGDLDAYAILRGLAEASRSIELKRIVIATPEQGLGRAFLGELIRMAFEEFRAHRLFLDVYEDNARARHLYESLGFVYEGTLREAALRDGRFCNLRLMSLLDREFTPWKQ
jgi:diamine N-acetyltransferase